MFNLPLTCPSENVCDAIAIGGNVNVTCVKAPNQPCRDTNLYCWRLTIDNCSKYSIFDVKLDLKLRWKTAPGEFFDDSVFVDIPSPISVITSNLPSITFPSGEDNVWTGQSPNTQLNESFASSGIRQSIPPGKWVVEVCVEVLRSDILTMRAEPVLFPSVFSLRGSVHCKPFNVCTFIGCSPESIEFPFCRVGEFRDFADLSDAANDYQFQGNAMENAGALVLTQGVAPGEAGSAWFKTAFQNNSFNAVFDWFAEAPELMPLPPGRRDDGLTFTFQSSPTGLAVLGGNGGRLGLAGPDSANPNVSIVLALNDSQTGNRGTNVAIVKNYFNNFNAGVDVTPLGPNQEGDILVMELANAPVNGENSRVWVDYDYCSKEMQVFFAVGAAPVEKPSEPIVSAIVDLEKCLTSCDPTYVGFTAGVRGIYQAQYRITSFDMNDADLL